MSRKYVLDACSVIAYLADEEGADVVENLLVGNNTEKIDLLMHKLNFYEVFYDTWKSKSEATAMEVFKTIEDSPVEIIDSISDELMIEAARFKANYRMSVADSFAIAAAKQQKAILVTSDHHEFDPVDKAGEVEFLWIR